MKLFILHHHLDTGGVTKIIHSQVASLKKMQPHLPIQLLLGKPTDDIPKGLSEKDILVDAGFGYLNKRLNWAHLIELEERLSLLFRMLLSKEDILHVHNINLGKNPVLSLVIHGLVLEGYRVFNHCHDFAEDGRPENYRLLKHVIEDLFDKSVPEVLYTSAPNCLYGVLNSRDESILKQTGIPSKNIYLVLNPVHQTFLPSSQSREVIRKKFKLSEPCKLIVYPVRGIRRKNIGELVLLSALFQKQAHWVLTKKPKNRREIPNYLRWQSFSKKLKLPVSFGLKKTVTFENLIASADKMVTTSIVEGFGMAFLEPWLLDKSIVGRDIPDITKDFKACGLRLGLYTSLKIPKSWVPNKGELESKYVTQLEGAYNDFSLPIPKNLQSKVHRQKFSQAVDFADLDSESQMSVIRKAATEPRMRNRLIRENGLDKLMKDPSTRQISNNKAIVERKFSLDDFGKQLGKIYRRLEKLKTPDPFKPKKVKIKENPVCYSFLRPKDFYLIRNE